MSGGAGGGVGVIGVPSDKLTVKLESEDSSADLLSSGSSSRLCPFS